MVIITIKIEIMTVIKWDYFLKFYHLKNEFIFWEKNREKRLVDIFQSDICHMFTVEKMHLLLSHSFALAFGLTVRITSADNCHHFFFKGL